MRLDFDAGHDGFHIAAVVEQRRQAGPAFFAHAVSFIEDGDAAANHGGDQRRGDVAKAAGALDHRGDQQVFGTRVHGGLQDVDLAPHTLARGVGESGLADAGLAEQARAHRQVLFVNHHPRRQQVAHQLALPHPLGSQFIGMGQVEGDAFDFNRHVLFYYPASG